MSAVSAALAELGKKRLLLAIHDVSFPSDLDEDLGRGSPGTDASARFLGFVRTQGFTGLQLGPQGQTSRSNPSPYDGTIFSRHVGTIALASLRATGPLAGLVDDAAIDAALVTGGNPQRADHAHAHDAMERLLDEAYANLPRERPDLVETLRLFRREHASWLEPDALFAALSAEHGGRTFRAWPEAHARFDRTLLAGREAAIDRYAFAQLLAHLEHVRVRRIAGGQGLALYGDLQVGYAEADAWTYASRFLRGYAMGAPPSRTNPDGQPWSYPVLDPDQLETGGAALALVLARFEHALFAYDSLRIDHPHGLVCPWVYRMHTGDDLAAVAAGARLYESPDLADHPELAPYAIARPEQIDRTRARYADGWVRDLDEAQVTRFARLFTALGVAAARHGRALSDLSCEVLSTMPTPLGKVLERYGLGRWRVTQKANLDDRSDVYRAENAARADWVMLGNHDTPPILSVIAGWPAEKRASWVRHLRARLALEESEVAALDARDGALATAMLAELFASDAENISIFWADLFGETERFNAPGTVSAANWSLRLPGNFEQLFTERRERGAALDLPHALELARVARRQRA